jgi:diguanylate cyclase (GGDEF)-like protein
MVIRHGHLIGDEVLRLIARRLENSMRSKDVVVRLGGDEFVAVVELANPDKNIAANLATKLATAIAAPLRVDRRTLALTASIGIAMYPGDGDDLKTLLAVADNRMYDEKQVQKPATVLRII